jgi:hypothetical protein
MASNTTGSTPGPEPKQQVIIELPDKSFHPAAMAVLAGLYHVKPWPEVLADLIPQQQVQAAVLADTWGLTAAGEAAETALMSATECTDMMSAVIDELLSLKDMPKCLLPVFVLSKYSNWRDMPNSLQTVFDQSWQATLSQYNTLSAVPQSMLPLLEQILLTKYGDLEAVWAPGGGSLQESLLALPLYAMELLLASDKLKVRESKRGMLTLDFYCRPQSDSYDRHSGRLRLRGSDMFENDMCTDLLCCVCSVTEHAALALSRRLSNVQTVCICAFVCSQVASEDTVLYTAQAYVDGQSKAAKAIFGATPTPTSGAQQAPPGQLAVDKLAPLVRCPHLSQFWLSASVLSDGYVNPLLDELQSQLRQLIMVKAGCSRGLSADDIKKAGDSVNFIGAKPWPASWLLPVRDIQPVSSMKLDWKLDVAAIRQAAQDSARQKKDIRYGGVHLRSPTSCLLGGLMWDMSLSCIWDSSIQGSRVGLAACTKKIPYGTLCRCTYSLECVGVDAVGSITETRMFTTLDWKVEKWAVRDFFKIGSMHGGFDAASWAAKGLPASGNITLRLTVKDVGV